jgi:DNA-binding XRE family transcriptional regulator
MRGHYCESFDNHARRETAERASTCGTRCQEAIGKGDAANGKRNGLKGELALALEATKADADLTATQTALATIPAPTGKDPQAAALAAYVPFVGFTEREAALLVTLLPSLIVETGGPVSFLIASALFGMAPRRPAAPSLSPAAPLRRQIAAPVRESRPAVLTGPELSALRAALGEGQEVFAARFDVDARTIRRWEKGEREISRTAALKAGDLARSLRIPAA